MRKILQHKFLTAAVLLVFLSACSKKVEYIAEPNSADGKAYIKLLHVAPNFTTLTGLTDKVSVFYTAPTGMYTKITGTTLAYDSYFPTTTNTYVALDPGTHTLRFSIGGVVLADSINFYNTQVQLEAGKKYSYFLTDNIKSNAMFLADNVPAVDTNSIALRFVHAILNDTAGKAVDVYSKRNNAVIFSSRNAATSSDFATFAYTSVSDTLVVRRAGTSFALATLNGFSSTKGRSYSIVYKGNGAVTTTTAKPRSLAVYGH